MPNSSCGGSITSTFSAACVRTCACSFRNGRIKNACVIQIERKVPSAAVHNPVPSKSSNTRLLSSSVESDGSINVSIPQVVSRNRSRQRKSTNATLIVSFPPIENRMRPSLACLAEM